MKIFQIVNDICFYDISKIYPTVESTVGYFTPETLFVEAPDYVFEGWEYNPNEIGNNRFIKPISPEGWLYDDQTGTFYPENIKIPQDENISPEEFMQMIEEVL